MRSRIEINCDKPGPFRDVPKVLARTPIRVPNTPIGHPCPSTYLELRGGLSTTAQQHDINTSLIELNCDKPGPFRDVPTVLAGTSKRVLNTPIGHPCPFTERPAFHATTSNDTISNDTTSTDDTTLWPSSALHQIHQISVVGHFHFVSPALALGTSIAGDWHPMAPPFYLIEFHDTIPC